jgi:hypothetical protein
MAAVSLARAFSDMAWVTLGWAVLATAVCVWDWRRS